MCVCVFSEPCAGGRKRKTFANQNEQRRQSVVGTGVRSGARTYELGYYRITSHFASSLYTTHFPMHITPTNDSYTPGESRCSAQCTLPLTCLSPTTCYTGQRCVLLFLRATDICVFFSNRAAFVSRSLSLSLYHSFRLSFLFPEEHDMAVDVLNLKQNAFFFVP